MKILSDLLPVTALKMVRPVISKYSAAKFSYLALLIVALVPGLAVATSTCSVDGFTAVFVNGIFTTQSEAEQGRKDLESAFRYTQIKDQVHFLLGYNASHLAGAGDLVQSMTQAFGAPVSSYDLKTILTQIHSQVTTQKILLVGHSQGTFYTNALYDYLTANGVPGESIAVYNLATPASFVSGGGTYLTSANDKLINKVREFAAAASALEPLPANILIPYAAGEENKEWGGHSFSGSYLGMKPARVVSDVEGALKKLSASKTGGAGEGGCFTPPPNNIAYKISQAAFAVGDPAANSVRSGALAIGGAVKHFVDAANSTLVFLGNIGRPQAGAAAFAVTSAVPAPKPSVKPPPPTPVAPPKPAPTNYASVPISVTPPVSSTPVPTPQVPVQLLPTPPVTPGAPYGLSFIPQSSSGAPPVVEEVPEEVPEEKLVPEPEEPTDETPPGIPIVSVSECNVSLSSDFCLIPNTTVTLIWNDALDATYYATTSNGILSATTTATTTTLTLSDNATTTLAVVAYDNAGNAATSTDISIRVATQALIISEVAWAGTDASASDEWIELYNPTDFSINLGDITLAAVDSVPELALSGSLAPGAYYLIERTDDNSVASVAGNLVVPFSGSGTGSGLSNDGEELLLVHRFGTSFATTIDRTPAVATCSGWCAGTVSVLGLGASSMERAALASDGSLATSWQQAKLPTEPAKDADNENICGTPGEGLGSDDCPMPILPTPQEN